MEKPDYGIDAPGQVRGLLIGGGTLLALCLLVPLLASSSDGLTAAARSLRPAAIAMIAAGSWMLWSSKVGKIRLCRRMLALHAWRGDERVLDVGCGRGLSLIGAAARLDKGGQATGIDLWSAKDLSGNAPERTLANARLEGVADRVSVDTGDARALPYADGSFDVVTSMTAIHNIRSAAGRAEALAEMARVLKPGGRLLLFDIFHPFAYARVLRSIGLGEVRRAGFALLWALPGVILSARKA
jgi:SAM-dependent methyltransferase